MPFANFEMIHNEADLLSFFEKYFADAIPLMGKDLLVKEYFKNPKGSLVMVRVCHWGRGSSVSYLFQMALDQTIAIIIRA